MCSIMILVFKKKDLGVRGHVFNIIVTILILNTKMKKKRKKRKTEKRKKLINTTSLEVYWEG